MPILYDFDQRLFHLQGKASSYLFCIDESGIPAHLYWGGRLDDTEGLPTVRQHLSITRMGQRQHVQDIAEYPAWGGYCYSEPCLKATFADGVRDVTPKYMRHTIDGNRLTLWLMDEAYGLEIELRYHLIEALDLLERSAVIRNRGKEKVKVEKAFSACFRLPVQENYRLTSMVGGWCKEYRMQTQPVNEGQIVLQTKTGMSGPQCLPYWRIDEQGTDRVYFGAVRWSGNWKIVVEKDEYGRVAVCGGINDFDLTQNLLPGEALELPPVVCGFTAQGQDAAARQMQQYVLQTVMPPKRAKQLMPICYNSFGSLFCDISEERLMPLIPLAAQIGAEYFVIDDGWFGRGEDYWSGLGDWQVNPERFPNGLLPISKAVQAAGMKFGLWVELEVISPRSQIYREHPEWIYRYPTREPLVVHDRLSLNLGREDVLEYLFDTMCRVIDENKVSYIKWDYNRFVSQPGWQEMGEKQQELWVRHTRNLHRLQDRLTERYPDLILEACAAGGARVDVEMAAHVHLFNRSDNQDSMDTLKMFEGFTRMLPPKMMAGGFDISDCVSHPNGRKGSVQEQALSGMLGCFGVGEDLMACSVERLEEIRQTVERYKQLRPITQFGDLYVLRSAYEHPYAAYQYQLGDEGVLFAIPQLMQFRGKPPRLRLKGLDASVHYEVEGFGRFSGNVLMEIGLPLSFGETGKGFAALISKQ